MAPKPTEKKAAARADAKPRKQKKAAARAAASAAAEQAAAAAPPSSPLPPPTPSTPPPPSPKGIDCLKPHWPKPITTNVVATVDLGCHLDLNIIAQQAWNVEYKLKRFHAAIMRIRDPKTTSLIFASGKLVVIGAKSVSLARLAARKHARIIMKCGFEVGFSNFRIQNFVGCCSLDFTVRLEGLAYQYPLFANYEPELFPGLVYRIAGITSKRVRGEAQAEQSAVLLVFTTGKIVITGSKSEDEMYEAFAKVYPLLLDHKVPVGQAKAK